MGVIKDKGDWVYRDFSADGMEASGPNAPPKKDVRDLFALIETVVAAVSSGIGKYETVADLPAGATEGTLARVYGDPAPENNTYYEWNGAAWNVAAWYVDLITGPAGADGADGTLQPSEVRQAVASDGVLSDDGGLFLLARTANVVATRATSGWAVGNGMMAGVKADNPRVSDRGLLMAAARTQKITENTDYSTWATASGAVKAASPYTAPNGIVATKVTGAASAFTRISKAYNLALAASHVAIVLVKNDPAAPAPRSSIYIDKANDADAELEWLWNGAEFAAYRTETGFTGFRPIHVGDGWWIIGGSFISDSATAAHTVQLRPDTSGTAKSVHLGQYDAYEAVQAMGPMRNAADAADVWRVPVAMDKVFTASADFEVPSAVSAMASPILTLDNGDGDNDDALRIYLDNAGKVRFRATLAGATIADEVCANAALPATDLRATLLVSPTHYRFWVGDNLIGEGTFTGALPSISRLLLGEDGAGNKLNSSVGAVTLANGDLSAKAIDGAPVAKLYRLHGQSNAAGRGAFAEVASAQYTYKQMDARLWVAPNAFSLDDFSTDASFKRINWTSGGSAVTMSDVGAALGMEGPLMHGVDRNTFLAKYAIGGTQLAQDAGIEDWDPDSAGELYDLANECHDTARAYLTGAGYKVRCIATVWYQGEKDGDSGASTAAYEANLSALGDAWKAYHDALGDTEMKFVVCRLAAGQTNVVNLAAMRAAQAAMVAARPDYALLADLDAAAVQADNLHLTGEGQVAAAAAVRAALRSAGVFS
ncbi:MAG: hypothetical protein OSA41_05855 [Erythrobacter sp.]|jgi:hypothetical protein|nr:hypothetical protein [Erythrobacter sp.]|tara:strand:- start:4137 stop:6443 length:2307 start_codon:yes stop_codon:yes gene_type:complete